MRKEARRLMGHKGVVRDVLCRVKELIGREERRKWGGE